MSRLKKTFKLTLLAEEDLVGIYLYGKIRWGKSRASEFIKAIYGRFEWLASHPEIGLRRDELYLNCRSFPHDNYVILYRYVDQVEIITIVHGSRDIPAHLGEFE